ncbi:MAG: diaminopimelate epimerase [Flavobacteriales bacterium]|jgi:diaminopimelate epimerase|uniref:diaminopimelate epimerase n=1 Tax=Blattabacterium sp. (Mastotermes darwiniensis) TaxID=39768 RepID=UPI000231DFA6|nr:diaminopimelate epimerase [Blattabacterium sp. (Mastotermes darwiniensis)]AER40446.1 diaminopimelate epimerase [Blattabacterium sp. (Mastotermes darwiniensis) str. MADAR]MDR1805038.1 diaminopimelate epimerase [Flavobacteriales bacterium]
MKIYFFKYQGTGNDFIMLDIRKKKIPEEDPSFFPKLCNRNFGIGADGIILIKNDCKSDFYMKYYNSNGKESTMCGNGGRCAVSFSKKLGITKKNKIFFRAIDGNHYGIIQDKEMISINLIDIEVDTIKIHQKYVFLNTGSPHHVIFVKNIKKIDVYKKGRKIRFHRGVNVNFVEVLGKNTLKVRTYERGVENETLSCGTGVTASVIAAYETGALSFNNGIFLVYTLGGKLWVSFQKIQNRYENIYLTGSVKFIFEGWINI